MQVVQRQQELFDAIRKENIPLDIFAIWDEILPDEIKHICQSPDTLFSAFVKYPDAFPCADEFLILWQTNGDSITAYLRAQKIYVRWHVEDGPLESEFEILGRSYQQLIARLLAHKISRGIDRRVLEDISAFFRFEYLQELTNYVQTSSDWEGDGSTTFIASIEAQK
ncbi:hypothetical protein ACO0LL_28340 [Undibacterium sp. TC4M20W]|uniref:hypothetical protein n=1 Tax=Undibacterium sp. TC4M20W TaxID=3413052 RepID=UPI003BF08D94